MESLKKFLTGLLILSILNFYLPHITLAEEHHLSKIGITKHKPEILSTPEEEIPTERVKKVSRWTWLIAIGLIGGVAGAAAGGGGGGGNGAAPPPSAPSETGSYTASW